MSATKLKFGISTREFGIKGDGVADDTAKFSEARATARASGVPLYIYGKVKISSPIVMTVAESWIGDWAGFEDYVVGSRIIWAGSSGATMVEANTVFAGIRIEGLVLDCNFIAGTALHLDDVHNGFFTNLRIENFTDKGLSTDSSGYGTQWNTFTGLSIVTTSGLASAGIFLDGHDGNTCHCSFYTTTILGPAGMPSLTLRNCDNNSFHDLYTYSVGSSWGSVTVEPVIGASMPIANYFFHLQAAWEQPGTTEVSPGIIFGYDTANSQPAPVLNGSPGPIVYFGIGEVGENVPTLLNSWVNFGGAAQTVSYYKDTFGVVHIRGVIKNGTSTAGTVLFQLPVGYRPQLDNLFPVTSGGYGAVIVKADSGNVAIESVTSNATVGLGKISFRASP